MHFILSINYKYKCYDTFNDRFRSSQRRIFILKEPPECEGFADHVKRTWSRERDFLDRPSDTTLLLFLCFSLRKKDGARVATRALPLVYPCKVKLSLYRRVQRRRTYRDRSTMLMDYEIDAPVTRSREERDGAPVILKMVQVVSSVTNRVPLSITRS